MRAKCKKCGRPLNNPESIARGIGPECAGISAGRGKSVAAKKMKGAGTPYDTLGKNQETMPLFNWTDDDSGQKHVPVQLARFPSDLLNLVLSAPGSSAIAMRVKSHKRKWPKGKGPSPITSLKEIRRK